MVIVEENKGVDQVIGSTKAPFLNSQLTSAAQLTAMDAGYPPECPSLAAYIILTSGSQHDICDDKNPVKHQLEGENIFSQVAAAGLEYRVYAESMEEPCQQVNSKNELYAVRHTAASYYVSEKQRCRRWQVPLGELTGGALHDDLVAGSLPAYSLVVPNMCNDMHGVPSCPDQSTQRGDAWLQQWIPVMLDSPDYAAGRLVIIITWDEGTRQDNHIPTLIYSPGSAGKVVDDPTTHCTTLRLTQDLLGLTPLGCAAEADQIATAAGVTLAQRTG
jgi:phospholipase C